MRTTLDIADDILRAAKELAQRDDRTVGEVISDLARRGLRAPLHEKKQRSATRVGVPVLPSRGKVITIEDVQRLKDDEGI